MQQVLFSYIRSTHTKREEELLYYKKLFALTKIMEENQINTFFQPIMDLQTTETFAFEALNRPSSTNVFPSADAFFEFIGQTDRVFDFECFCRNLTLKRFKSRLPDNEDYTLFINIHPSVLLDKTYQSGETLKLVTSLGISPNQVVFELTERSAVTDFVEFERVLSNYRAQGFRIAIDDVGSGYNSLKTLVYLKPEFIKVDGSLVRFIDHHKEQQQLFKMLMMYVQELDTKIIAEGVERLEELEFLQEIGVHYAQGYALGRPNHEILQAKKPM
ncbi:EAL domain-containing protein [Metasolibacillus sp. FSL K6-0083]